MKKMLWVMVVLYGVLGYGEEALVFEPEGVDVEIWASQLVVPWSLVFVSRNTALVSERGGRILVLEEGGKRGIYLTLPVYAEGEAGLLGLALHPQFPAKPYVYALYTYRTDEGIFDRVVRIRHEGQTGVVERVIIDKIPAARFHAGGRIAFGPDGKLYITTGDALKPTLAQEKDSLAGKILRLNEDGTLPQDNPWGTAVWSIGHRNPQGLAWHPVFGMFASEHGPSGEKGWYGHDEINRIHAGKNYGWPEVRGAPNHPLYVDPIIFWEKATPPSGMTFLGDDLFVATLRSEALLRLTLQKKGTEVVVVARERWFASPQGGKYGRLRDVVVGPDGALYVLTSNRDGRGRPKEGDDKILRIQWKRRK
ncbi:MAG: PQQ-dependent sugar dehydrogenase [Brevinematales bacterium]|nr:PQQ-dependent sugar dehydrogenase [Brevinematales bacterium]